ncbi:flagellar hook-length control protein FliK [Gemmata sp. JC673]|uniref:Flagellar hook-length control protein FliK n=1 Tax=Gemmata algarum TaxID=2975278 RepID=A0ABU5F6V7_9BACT|nr:flagellar hook-length control protein FliK [Gemmata algarum]MDY3563045.1 flagellar hook-length control protein FliK [Gemmata algarum]
MQVTPADIVSVTTAQVSTAASVRVVAGDLASVPLGALLQAVVTQVDPRQATLDVNGQSLTVRPPIGLQTGAVLFVRVPNAGGSVLEVTTPPRAPKPEVQSVPTGSTQVKVVEVLDTLPDGRVQVRIEGQEQTATARDPLTQAPLPLAPGSRAVLEVVPTPAGVVLRPPAETPVLPVAVATALLQATPTNDLTAALKPLQAELTQLVEGTAVIVRGEAKLFDALGGKAVLDSKGGVTETPLPRLPAAVREAAEAVRETIRSLVPSEPRVPSAGDLQKLVENGGLQFEAKLARLAEDPQLAGALPRQTAAEVRGDLRGDLKGDLLRLIQTTREFGLAVQFPAARAALEGIEAQQATQTLAQATGTPYILQVPFPDRDQWRTLHLAVEREGQSGDENESESGPGRFRMLMHVPLSELGETWIDAGLSGGQFRAAIYLDRSEVRDRVREALPELRTELSTDGFAEVLLDVRATADLPKKTRERSSAMLAGRPASTSLLDVRA